MCHNLFDNPLHIKAPSLTGLIGVSDVSADSGADVATNAASFRLLIASQSAQETRLRF